MSQLTPEQVQKLREAGYTPAKIAAYERSKGLTPTRTEAPGLFSDQGAVGKAARTVTNFLGGEKVAKTFGSEIAKIGADDETKRLISEAQPTARETLGSGLKLGSTFVPSAAVGSSLTKLAAYGAGAGYLYDIGQNLEDGDTGADVLEPGASTLVGGIAAPSVGPVANAAAKGASKIVRASAGGLRDAGRAVTDASFVRGAGRIGRDFAERVPRFISKKQATIRDAATRAERIQNSPPPIGQALNVGVDERIVNTVEQADPATLRGYRDIVRIAEDSIDTTGTLKTNARPEIVAGDAAAEQYKLIDQQRRTIGSEIGRITKELKADQAQRSMQPAYAELDNVLQDIGVATDYGEDGVRLDFAKTGYTKAQRAKIQELYDLATEGGDTLTAAEIHAKDRLFSQLQRETRMEGIGDIIVDGPEGPTSLFRIFRDVYSEQLEQISPELRTLNRQYRNLVTFTDDIENSIIKTGKFEGSIHVDPAEFAQTNLRRLFSEAQSAADYRAIAEEMDAASRALGYSGAKPEDLARFAYEIRKIYPETTPRTGFEGSIRASVGGLVDAVIGAGKADNTDKQKALRELIDYLSTNSEI